MNGTGGLTITDPLAALGSLGGTGTLAGVGQSGFVGRTNTGFVGNRLASDQGAGTGRSGATGRAGTAGGLNQGTAFRGGLTQSQFGNRGAFGQQNRSQFGTGQQGRNGGFGGGGFGGGFNGMNGLGANAQVPLQVRQRIAFTYPDIPAGRAATRLDTQFNRMAPRNPAFAQVSLELDGGGTVVLQGTVPTAEASAVAEAMARLEPGVREVRNELQIAP
jgi:hypothetical protein